MNIAFALDGALSTPTGDLVQKSLILYRALKCVGRVVLLTDMARPQAEAWLMVNNIVDYDDLIDNSVEVDPEQDLRERQLQVLSSRGPIYLYVEAHPTRAETGLRMGISTVLFAESEYSHFLFRPDARKGARPWDELVAERTRQQALIATDHRVVAMEMGQWE